MSMTTPQPPAAKKTPAKKTTKKATKAAVKAAGKPKPLKADELDINLLEQGPKFIQRLIAEETEIADIYKKGTKLGWFDPGNSRGITLFKNEVMGSKWWEANSDDAKRAWALERTNAGEFNNQIETAKREIRRLAATMGAGQLSEEELSRYAREWIYKGWDNPSKRIELEENLSGKIGMTTLGGQRGMRGDAGKLETSLRNMAERNGLRFNDTYYTGAAQSVARGLSSEDDWIGQIRQQAASMWPGMSEQILAGLDARDVASGYINLMASEFDLDPNSIGIDDPYIMQAFGSMGENGRPQQMSLWDFRTKLREDPRWMGTLNAQNEMASLAQTVLKTFGVLG